MTTHSDFGNKAACSPLLTLYEKNVFRYGIRIAAPYHAPTTTYLEFRNQSQKRVAFRLKCTHPTHFTVKPRSMGLIAAKGCQEIRLTLLPTYNVIANYHLLIETTFISQTRDIPEQANKTEVLAMWNETNKADIATTRFPIHVSLIPDDEETPRLIVHFDEPQSHSQWTGASDEYVSHLMKLATVLYRNETFFTNGLVLLLLICQCFFLYFSFSMIFS